jgi:hypothetical protein
LLGPHQELDERDLPSVATIERHMVEILGGGSGKGPGYPGKTSALQRIRQLCEALETGSAGWAHSRS